MNERVARIEPLLLVPSAPDAGYVELSPASRSVPLAPAFVLGPFPAPITRFYFGETEALSVGCYNLADAGVTSHGLLVRDGRLVLCDQLNLNPGSIAEARLYGAVREGAGYTSFIDGPVVSLAGPGHLIYGHWLVDFLPKLYVLHATGFDPHTARYLIPANTPGFAFEWLHLLGIRNNQLIRFDPYRETVGASRLIVPTLLRTNSRAHGIFRNAALYIVSLATQRGGMLPPAPGRERIFVSRRSANRDGRALLNRDTIERMAEEAGFALVEPETLPILEQIALFAGAGQIIGEYGSALHGSMFAPPGAMVCALRASAFHPGFLQSGVCQAMRQSIGYLFGDAAPNAVEQKFSIDANDFRWCLRLLQLYRDPEIARNDAFAILRSPPDTSRIQSDGSRRKLRMSWRVASLLPSLFKGRRRQ